MADEPIRVECYAGATGDEVPRVVFHEGRRHDVVEVLERWIEEWRDPAKGRRRWFRVRFLDGKKATLYLDLALAMWFMRGRGTAGPDHPGDPPGG